MYSSADQPAFCEKGGRFQRVQDVPRGDAGCSWGFIDLGGNAPHADSRYAGRGHLVRDRTETLAGTLMTVSDVADAQGHAEVTFDLVRTLLP